LEKPEKWSGGGEAFSKTKKFAQTGVWGVGKWMWLHARERGNKLDQFHFIFQL